MPKLPRLSEVIPLAALLLLSSLALAQEPPTNQVAVERLTIRYQDGEFALENRQSMRKVLPPSSALPEGDGPFSGFWYELHDGEGMVVYRRTVDNPLVSHFEGPDIDGGGTVPDRKEAIAEAKTLWVLIPAPPPNAALVIFSSPLAPGAQAEAAQEIGRIPISPIIQ